MQPQSVAVGSAQVRDAEVDPGLLPGLQQQHAEPGQRHLGVGGTDLQRHDVVDGHVRRWSFRSGGRPGQVCTQVSGLNGDDGLAVAGGVLRDPPQRVESADACFQLVTAELIDGRAEPVGDIALLSGAQAVLADSQLPPGGVRAEQHDHAAHGLQKRRTDVVHCFQPVLRSDARPGGIVVDHHTRQAADARLAARIAVVGPPPWPPGSLAGERSSAAARCPARLRSVGGPYPPCNRIESSSRLWQPSCVSSRLPTKLSAKHWLP